MTTTWEEREYESGAPYLYNLSDITYNHGTYNNKSVRYNSIGVTTDWTLQAKN